MNNNLIRVAAISSPHRVAGAIAQQMRAEMQANVQAIGPVAVNQMVKAVIIACRYLQSDGIQTVFVPSFVEVSVDGQPRTAVRLHILADGCKIDVAHSSTIYYNVCTVAKPPYADASSIPHVTDLASAELSFRLNHVPAS